MTAGEDTILGSYVTWTSVEETLQEHFHTRAKLAKKEATVLHSQGFMSSIFKLHIEWTAVTKHIRNRLPKDILLKICSLHGQEDIHDNPDFEAEDFLRFMKLGFDYEYNFYDSVEKEERKHPELSDIFERLTIPEFYGAQPFTEDNKKSAYLLMEFLDNKKVYPSYEYIPKHFLSLILRAIAKVHYVSVKTPLTNNAVFKEDVVGNFVKTAFGYKSIAGSLGGLTVFDDEMKRLVDDLLRVSEDIWDPTLPMKISGLLGMKPVIAHGDMWHANAMFDKETEQVTILDWQIELKGAHLGSAAEDLIRLLNFALPPKERKEEWRDYLKEFYGYLKEEFQGDELPYTYEQLLENYRRLYPMMSFFFLRPSVGVLTEMNRRGAPPNVLNNIMEKVKGSLEDMVTMHKENVAAGPL